MWTRARREAARVNRVLAAAGFRRWRVKVWENLGVHWQVESPTGVLYVTQVGGSFVAATRPGWMQGAVCSSRSVAHAVRSVQRLARGSAVRVLAEVKAARLDLTEGSGR